MDYDSIARARDVVSQRNGPLPVPNRCYIVLMSPRSGSNLLCVHLEKIGFGRPVEGFHFNPRVLSREYGWEMDCSDPYTHIRQVLDYGTVDGVFGLKLSWVEFEGFLCKARKLTNPAGIELSDAELVEVFFPSPIYIHLKRRNKIKQAVSYARAMQDGIWLVSTEQNDSYKDYLMPAQYDREHIEAIFDNLLSFDLAWENYLNKNDLSFYELWYEDFAQDYENKMAEIYSLLGIMKEYVIAPPLKKQADTLSQDWVRRFREETPWLEDQSIATALQSGDFSSIYLQRTMRLVRQNERRRWSVMPANRNKKLKKLLFRFQRKLNSLRGASSITND